MSSMDASVDFTSVEYAGSSRAILELSFPGSEKVLLD
jgi:hypothetical protein